MHTWFVDDPNERQGLGQFFDESELFGLSFSFKQKLMHFFSLLRRGLFGSAGTFSTAGLDAP